MEEMKYLIENFHFANEIWVLLTPLILMAIDICTGTLNAWLKGKVKSSRMRTGLGKKAGEIVVLLLGELFSFAMKIPKGVMAAVALYIVLMELISIIENLAKLGVPIPNFIRKALIDASNKVNEETGDKTDKE